MSETSTLAAAQVAPDPVSMVSVDELAQRPSRLPDYAAENRALVALAQEMATSPDGILHKLADTALTLCRAHSAGFSLLEEEDQKRAFHWRAIRGQWSPHVGGGTPRDFSPCGTVVDRNIAMLCQRPERDFPYLGEVSPLLDEGLLIPFYVDGEAVGTIWVISHNESRRFDAEDLRVMTNLAAFAAAAYQTLLSINATRKANQELEESEARLQQALAAGSVAAFDWDVRSGLSRRSENIAEILGFDPQQTVSASSFLAHVHPDDRTRFKTSVRGVRPDSPSYAITFRFICPDGREVWLQETAKADFDAAGRFIRLKGLTLDITEHKQTEEQQRTLLAELDHRVKNALATVSAVVSRTRQGSTSVADFVATLDGRIRSMATTHELLSSRQSHGVSLTELARRELAPYATRNNTEINGPGILLKPEAGQAMAMVLHELATNAAKYGALSTKNGRVSIRWDRHLNGHPRSHLVFEWQEIGGPPVVALGKSGYGTSTIRDLIPYEFGGTVDLVLALEGVRCRLELPADWLANDRQPFSPPHMHHGEPKKPEFETGHWPEQNDR